jgi:hypothetical protein
VKKVLLVAQLLKLVADNVEEQRMMRRNNYLDLILRFLEQFSQVTSHRDRVVVVQ